MGIRKRVKGLVKRAVGRGQCEPCQTPRQAHAPPTKGSPKPVVESDGNLRSGEDVPWYLKFDDSDGWESTNAEDGVDED